MRLALPLRAVVAFVLALVLGAVLLIGAPATAQTDGDGSRTTDPASPAGPDADEEPPTGEATDEAIQGRLTVRTEGGEQVVVPQAEISIATADGEELATAVSDEDGRFRVGLPGPGEYVATLDVDTLPAGVSLRDPDRQSLSVRINDGQSRNLIFALGEGEGGGGGGSETFDRVLRLLASGVIFGLIIAISAVGLSLIFGTTGLTNFAHGELVTFGALLTYFFNVPVGLPLPLAAVLAVATAAVAGSALDRVFWRPLRRRGTGLIALLVISIGLGILLRYIFVFQFGGRLRALDYAIPGGSVRIGPVTLVPRELVTIAITVTVLVGVALVLQRTAIGKAMRAVADNRDLAEASGIDVQRVINVVWAAGTGLAALGGVLLGMAEQVGWLMGFQLLLLMFAGVILGGIGTAYGALVGSLVVGIFIQVSTVVIPTDLKNVGALVMLIIILVIRPQGILGTSERIG